MRLTALELCAGGGGQALGLETAGFDCAAAVEIEEQFCETLRRNRPKWKVIKKDIKELDPSGFKGVDLVAAGVPCPPFSIAGKQMGRDDERDLFPAAIRLVEGIKPPAVLFENVPGFASARFTVYRKELFAKLEDLGYRIWPDVINACNFGVPQLRPRFVLVALRERFFHLFVPPDHQEKPLTVGQAIKDLMASNYWPGADSWAHRANRIAPTIVGGSKKHGGPDLGPTRAKLQWREMGVDGMGIAESAPSRDFSFDGLPRLTVRMVARLQSFPDTWEFVGGKTIAYRQVGNAFPPLVAAAVGASILTALNGRLCPIYKPRKNPVNLRLFETPGKAGKKCRGKRALRS